MFFSFLMNLFVQDSLLLLPLVKSISGGYLAWGMGANDCANVFGPHIGSNLMRYRSCVIMFCVFVILGSVLYGQSMVEDAGDVLPDRQILEQKATGWSLVNLAVLVTFSAALTVNIATALGIPTSTSQGSIGAFFGLSLALGFQHQELYTIPPWSAFTTMALSWVISPFLAGGLGFLIQRYGSTLVNLFVTNERVLNRVLWILLGTAGGYGSFILGASHAGIAVAPFYRAGLFQDWLGLPASTWAAGLGGIAIALGAATYAQKVIYSVGTNITTLDPLSAFSSVVAMSLCVNVFKDLGIPVSSSQAIVGAVAGVGLTRGTRAISFRTLRRIILGWIATPILPALMTALLYLLVQHLPEPFFWIGV